MTDEDKIRARLIAEGLTGEEAEKVIFIRRIFNGKIVSVETMEVPRK